MIPTKRLVCVLTGAAAVFATNPVAALPISWSQTGSWQWFGPDTNNLPDYTPYCMDGSTTGIGIYVPTNWNTTTGKVMYWFDGGGYCFDNQTCNVNTAPSNPLQLLSGLPPAPFVFRKHFQYNPDPAWPDSSFQWYIAGSAGSNDVVNGMPQTKAILEQGIFDHTSSKNPFKDYLQVFIPYCTGDFHLGYKADTTDSSFRTHSGVNFEGAINAYEAIVTADRLVRAHINHDPTQVVVSGGSAGGFGALLLYSMIRQTLPADEKIVTISDSGDPYYAGTPNSNGTSWTTQGSWGFPTPRNGCVTYPNKSGPQCALPSAVTYQEAFMQDAWGTVWSQDAHTLFPNLNTVTPAGSPGPFMPMAEIVQAEIEMANESPSNDQFYIIDGNDDYLYTWFLSMYPNEDLQTASVNGAQLQLINTFGFGNRFHQVTAYEDGIGTFAGILPWHSHHGFLVNDVSTWDNTVAQGIPNAFHGAGYGSGVLQWLESIGGW